MRLTSFICATAFSASLAAGCNSSIDSPEANSEPPVEPEDPGGTEVPGDGATEFVSYVPGESDVKSGEPAATADSGESPAGSSDGANRAITEADILKLDGDTLYALSQYTGLTVIDLSDPSALRILGTYRSSGRPFEMYLENGTAYILYNGYESYEWDEEQDEYTWRSTSRLQAVDVSEPKSPRLLGDMNLAGEVSDSRKVGDIVYVVTYQSDYCWGCDDQSNTRISSFDVSDPKVFAPVDEEVFVEDTSGWGRRSVSVTQDRMYISGVSWADNGESGTGSIQVVDISDPLGEITKGSTVPIGGMIESRWQMDEFEGVLRVISQPGQWRTTDEPILETFAVTSATEIVAMAQLPMKLPRPEDLRSVRFDGERAFAVTFEQTDPLFTFDLSDPEHPLQVGELEIPGWLHHMEPRGDRLYALGFDPEVDNGALHVSLFDVSDLSNPSMLDRVNFGGDWGYFSEDQDRIHKLFNLALDQELILLPYSGGGYDEESCGYSYGSGIQLIDAKNDQLTLRGAAPQVGTARRALLHDDVLFGISDDAVQAFNIEDRDAPVLLDRLDVAKNVTRVKVMGDQLLRFAANWWTDEAELDLVALSEAEVPQSKHALDLSTLPMTQQQCNDESKGSYHYYHSSFGGEVFTHDSFAFVPRTSSESGQDGNGRYYDRSTMTIEIVDLSQSEAPVIVGQVELDSVGAVDDDNWYERESYAGFVYTDSALLVGRRHGYDYEDSESGESFKSSFFYDVIDLTQGKKAKVVHRLEVPEALSQGGFGRGVMGCGMDIGWGFADYNSDQGLALVSGDIVVSQHQEPIDDGSGRVRYFLDRIDLSDPLKPEFLGEVNIPGQVIKYDHATGRVVTLDDTPELLEGIENRNDCYEQGNGATFEYNPEALDSVNYGRDWDTLPGTCVRWHRRLHSLVIEDGVATRLSLIDLNETDTGDTRYSGQVSVTDSRIFFETAEYEGKWDQKNRQIAALGYATDGQLSLLGATAVSQNDDLYGMVARGKRAFFSQSGQLKVVTSPNVGQPETASYELFGYSCSSSALEVVGDTVYCAQGKMGVQAIELE